MKDYYNKRNDYGSESYLSGFWRNSLYKVIAGVVILLVFVMIDLINYLFSGNHIFLNL